MCYFYTGLSFTADEPTPSTSTSVIIPAKKQQQTNLSKFVSRPISLSRQKKINDLILNMIIKDLQPFSIVRDTGFLELLRELEPNYTPPCRNTFITSLLEEKYVQTKTMLKSILEETEFITITTDGWTSLTNESYISVTAHFITKKWEFVSCLLSCFGYSERHTAQNLHDEISEILREWGISEKVFAMVTDNAANVVAAVKMGSWVHVPCFAHTLNLIVQNGLLEIKEIRAKVKAIVEYFHRSSQANSKLLSTQTRMEASCVPLKLKNDVPTRWNSTYYMFERFLKLEEPVTVTLGLLHNPVQSVTEEEWKILKEICQVLKPFEQVTVEMSSEKCVTASKIIVIIRGLLSILKKYQGEMSCDITKKLIQKLLTSCSMRFDNCEFNTVLTKPSILDPRFKLKAFSHEQARKKAKDRIQDETVALLRKQCESTATTEDDNSNPVTKDDLPCDLVWQEFESSMDFPTQKSTPMATAIAEMRMYMEEPYIMRRENHFCGGKPGSYFIPRSAS